MLYAPFEAFQLSTGEYLLFFRFREQITSVTVVEDDVTPPTIAFNWSSEQLRVVRRLLIPQRKLIDHTLFRIKVTEDEKGVTVLRKGGRASNKQT